jgi:ABC-type dipeptide/oligopeptide/nickel transport system ATPase component
MKLVKNNISEIPRIPTQVDDLTDLPFVPVEPLPKKSFAMYIVGSPGSGKSNLMLSLMLSHPTKKNKKIPLYYFKYFDHIECISGSLQTLPDKFLNKLPDEQLHNKYDDQLMETLIESMRKGDNSNNLIILDDCIKDLKRSKILAKVFLNRRHCTHDKCKDKHGGLSIMTTSQKFNLLPLETRLNQSHYIIFKSSNKQEIDCIRNELMTDLSTTEQDEILQLCWNKPYSFLMIDINKPRDDKYFCKFDKIVFE